MGLGVIDRIIKEDIPLTVDAMDRVMEQLFTNIDDFLSKFDAKSGEEIAGERYKRFRKF